MATSTFRTKLPLDTWARIVGLQPLHFNGVWLPDIARSLCSQAWFQHAWQDAARVSRDDVAEAIALAERNMEHALGFRLMPTWEKDEWANLPVPIDQSMIYLRGADLRGFAASVQPKWGYLDTAGVRAATVVEAGVTIVWTDDDSDGYKETGTVVTAAQTVVTDECEVGVWYPGKSARSDAWQIRPLISVSIVAGVVTVKFRREQAVKEALLEDMGNDADGVRPVDGSDAANFLVTVDVYRIHNDASQMATLITNPPAGSCNCLTPGCSACGANVQVACLSIKGDRRIGRWAYTPATYDATTDLYTTAALSLCRAPDAIRLNYLAGWRWEDADCPRQEMDPQWARAVAHYAAALLERDLCDCTHDKLQFWRDDLAVSTSDTSGGTSRQIAPSLLENPFGTRRGMVMAWQAVSARGVRIAQAAGSR